MKAAVFRGIEDLQVEDVPEPEAGPDDVVVAVRAVGVCGSDLHTYTHGSFVAPGQIMGHEFAGEVVQAGSEVRGVSVGDRLTASPLVPCDDCPRCAEGRYNLCAAAWTQGLAYGRPGAFAERIRIPHPVPGQNVFPLGDDISDEAGALVEPLAVAVHAVKLAEPVQGATALVIGLGTIGLQVVQALHARGVAASSPSICPSCAWTSPAPSARRRIPAPVGWSRAGRRTRGGGEIDLVFECSGVPALAEGALGHVRAGGTIVVLALFDDPVTFNPTVLVQKEIRLQGSIAYTGEDFGEAVAMIRAGQAQSAPLITHREALDDISQAFATQLDKDHSIKVLVTPAGGS
jgi:2-desacetyl-2-hydroxyethyl bacteriochlorophyllide A dehydrogenase